MVEMGCNRGKGAALQTGLQSTDSEVILFLDADLIGLTTEHIDTLLLPVVNGQVVKEATVDHDKPRWKDLEVDLSGFVDQEITVRLEGHANGWSMEFGYWGGVTWE